MENFADLPWHVDDLLPSLPAFEDYLREQGFTFASRGAYQLFNMKPPFRHELYGMEFCLYHTASNTITWNHPVAGEFRKWKASTNV